MARHRRRHHRRHSRGSSSRLIKGVSNTTLAIGAAAAYFLFLRPAPATGVAGFGYSGSGLGDIYHGHAGTRTISPGLGAVLTAAALKSQPWSWGGANYSWGRPAMPPASAVLRANPTGLRGFDAVHGFWPSHLQGGLGALVHLLKSPIVVGNYGHLFAGGGMGSVHADDFSHLFAGGHDRAGGLGKFNNVSLNRRWWT